MKTTIAHLNIDQTDARPILRPGLFGNRKWAVKFFSRKTKSKGKERTASAGFTLAELLMVVMIISVLASLVIPRLMNQPEKARAAEAINMMGAIRKAEMTYFDRYDEYLDLKDDGSDSNNWLSLGIENPNLNPARFFKYAVNGAVGAKGLITATRTNVPAGDPLDGQNITLTSESQPAWSGTHPNKPECTS